MEHGLQRSIVNRRAHKRACSPDPAGNHTSRATVSIVPELEYARTRCEPRAARRNGKRSDVMISVLLGDLYGCPVLQD